MTIHQLASPYAPVCVFPIIPVKKSPYQFRYDPHVYIVPIYNVTRYVGRQHLGEK